MLNPIEPGKIFEIDYPFSRDEYLETPETSEGGEWWMYSSQRATPQRKKECRVISCWRPGCYVVEDGDGYTERQVWVCDGNGKMILTVVSTHKPGKYPERVFYLRKWRGPDGKEFGKNSLKIISRPGFKRLMNGYRYKYEVM